MTDAPLAKTPLHAWHHEHGGRLVDFAGWSMPVQYQSIIDEHHATRRHATLFDVSHMGRFLLPGARAAGWLDSVLTRRVTDMSPGRIRYSLVTRQDGGILDDVLVYHVPKADGEPAHWLVVNASNRTKIWEWLQAHGMADHVPLADDVTTRTAMIAVQGPIARALVSQTLKLPELGSLKYYTGVCLARNDGEWLVSRTGYTGEDGVELVVPADQAQAVWESLLAAGESQGVRAAGLGARDTLRLEAGMPLYGHELSESITPWQAGLHSAVNLADRQFPGRDTLATLDSNTLPQRVGLRLAGRRPAREHAPVLDASGNRVGEVTSGTFSPTLGAPIAMAYVAPEFATLGTQLQVDIRGKLEQAHVVALPFYQRAS
jgi:aminomethyltransferase